MSSSDITHYSPLSDYAFNTPKKKRFPSRQVGIIGSKGKLGLWQVCQLRPFPSRQTAPHHCPLCSLHTLPASDAPNIHNTCYRNVEVFPRKFVLAKKEKVFYNYKIYLL
jgi:hypothetical protein